MDTLDQIAQTAAALKQQAEASIAPTLAENGTPNAETKQDEEQRAANASDVVVSDALKAPTLAKNERSTPNATHDAPSVAHEGKTTHGATTDGGGIPPKKLGARKFFPDESTLSADQLPEKNSKQIRDSVRRTGHVKEGRATGRRLRVSPTASLRVLSNVKSKRMRQLFQLILENPTLDLPEAMKIMGYGGTYTPSSLAKSKGWQYMIKFYFPDEELAERERFLLFNRDPRMVNLSLDRIHKIRGSFNHAQKVELGPPGSFTEKTDKELLDIVEGEVLDTNEMDEEDQAAVNQPTAS